MSKKVLLLGLLCLFCAANVFAGNPVSVKKGSVSVFKTPSRALLEIDYSTAKVGKLTFEEYLKNKGNDYVRDWPRESETAASYFRQQFNKKSKGMKLTTDETDVAYKIVIRVKNLDMGDAGSYFVSMAITGFAGKAGGVIMSGSIEVIDLQTNKVVCTLYADDVQGKGNPKDAIRLGNMYKVLATNICKLK